MGIVALMIGLLTGIVIAMLNNVPRGTVATVATVAALIIVALAFNAMQGEVND